MPRQMKLVFVNFSFSDWQHCITYLRFLVKWNRMATCKTTHRNDCWIIRSAREGDPQDKVNNSPNFVRVNKSLIELRIETRNGLSKFKFHLFTLIQLQYNNNKKKQEEVKTELTIHWIKHNKGKECVAAKGAKLSSWLLHAPQSGYKWVEVI